MGHIKSFGALFVCIMGIAAVAIGLIDTPDRGSIAIVGAIPSGEDALLRIRSPPPLVPAFCLQVQFSSTLLQHPAAAHRIQYPGVSLLVVI